MSKAHELFQAMLTAGKKFNGGELSLSRGVHNPFNEDLMVAKFVIISLIRHLTGDWGDIGSDATEANNNNIKLGRLISIYNVPKDLRASAGLPLEIGDLVIVTEAGHRETLIMWYGEYESAPDLKKKN